MNKKSGYTTKSLLICFIALAIVIFNFSFNHKSHAAGATLPYLEYEAEDGVTNAVVHGPSTKYLSWEAEASGRKYVCLDSAGHYVQWKAKKAANTMVIRYSLPDSDAGQGITGTLSLYVNGEFWQKVSLTSKYAWVYGDYPWTKIPSAGNGHKVFDEADFFTARDIPAGAEVKLQIDADDTAPYYLIDLIDLEQVSELKPPADALSITSFGATSGDGTDDRKAIIDTINAAKEQGKTVWIPPGEFNVNFAQINVNDVTIRGAGMWYSKLTGSKAGFNLSGDNCRFYNFAIIGTTTVRNDHSAADNAFAGSGGKGSYIEGVWVEHKKCAVWMAGNTDGLQITKCRFRNLMADGVNFCNGTSNSSVTNTQIRYSGDDALATWSPGDGPGGDGNVFDSNTIQLPWLANGIALYGGSNHSVTNNLVYDTVTGGAGIYISSNFKPVPYSGKLTVSGNTLIRCGSNETYLGYAPGAIWINAYDSDMTDMTLAVTGNTIQDATQSGISIEGPKALGNTTISNNTIEGAGGYGIWITKDAAGNAAFEKVNVSGAALGGILNDAGANFEVQKGKANTGW
ncbi:right-handed parallel beta-helix repeat-containing protein [Paenibacillus protaetiae]|uniref:Pectate lyase superfamily protein domain-containing protein n=1 Tax=Paenibacillus protaetiae TaxID=2509456 RepID=A0A4P6FAN6_9BACL|nr:right-handed parallel beta-helix repeat-containing protein [Paenibacillus protaetiae]QAY67568.1 hypothetical protein ET464_15435 [Paenibacillus protaetiae]